MVAIAKPGNGLPEPKTALPKLGIGLPELGIDRLESIGWAYACAAIVPFIGLVIAFSRRTVSYAEAYPYGPNTYAAPPWAGAYGYPMHPVSTYPPPAAPPYAAPAWPGHAMQSWQSPYQALGGDGRVSMSSVARL